MNAPTDHHPPTDLRDWFVIALVILVALVIFVGGGVFLGLQNAAHRLPADQREKARQLKALAHALGAQNPAANATDSFYQVTPSQTIEHVPGDRPAVRFDSADALDRWLKAVTNKPLADAMTRLADVRYTRRIETLSLPSEQFPPPQIHRYFRVYRLDQPPGWIELETDADETTILTARHLDTLPQPDP